VNAIHCGVAKGGKSENSRFFFCAQSFSFFALDFLLSLFDFALASKESVLKKARPPTSIIHMYLESHIHHHFRDMPTLLSPTHHSSVLLAILEAFPRS
jgi:hypothetical protein